MGLFQDFVLQFKSGTGVSLRDVVDQLLQIVETNRIEIERLNKLLDRLESKINASSATGLRIEKHAQAVADDLTAAHLRADETTGPAGEAADSFSRTPND